MIRGAILAAKQRAFGSISKVPTVDGPALHSIQEARREPVLVMIRDAVEATRMHALLSKPKAPIANGVQLSRLRDHWSWLAQIWMRSLQTLLRSKSCAKGCPQ
jgi:hypothetical protein